VCQHHQMFFILMALGGCNAAGEAAGNPGVLL
jgi:hypothetical protein